MNEKRIEEIKKRISKVTPGIWTVEKEDDVVITADGIYVAQLTCDDLSLTKKHTIDEDAEFIVNAKEDIEYLLSLLDI